MLAGMPLSKTLLHQLARALGPKTATALSEQMTGGSIPGESLPTAETTGVTIDTTSYTNPDTEEPLTTIVFPAAAAGVLAIAIEGDAFPRWRWTADPMNGLYFAGGEVPCDYTHAAAIAATSGPVGDPDGSYGLELLTRHAAVYIGTYNADIGGFITTSHPIRLGPGMGCISSWDGDPNGNLGGRLGDMCIRPNGGDGSWIYRCTTAGDAATAVWTAKL